MPMVRHLNEVDKVLILAALSNAGVKARARKLRIGYRICFEGLHTAVVDVLNNEGFLSAAGAPFTGFSFNRSGEVFVRYARKDA